MDRRSFLRGTIGAVTTGALVVQASNADIVQFGRSGDPVTLSPPLNKDSDVPGVGELVFNHKGQILGVVTNVMVDFDVFESRSVGSEFVTVHRGLKSATMTVQLYGPAQVLTGNRYDSRR